MLYPQPQDPHNPDDPDEPFLGHECAWPVLDKQAGEGEPQEPEQPTLPGQELGPVGDNPGPKWREGDVAFIVRGPKAIRCGVVIIEWIAPVSGQKDESGHMYGVRAWAEVRCHWQTLKDMPLVLYEPGARFTASYYELEKPLQDSMPPPQS
jgi:hypothetical protein